MKKISVIMLLCFIVSCSSDDVFSDSIIMDEEQIDETDSTNEETETDTSNENETNESDELSKEQEDFITEFGYRVLGVSENSGNTNLNMKWSTDIKLFLDGTITSDYKAIVEEVIGIYNELFTDGTKIILVSTLAESNIHLFSSGKNDLAALWSDMHNAVKNSNSTVGYTSYSFSSNSISSGRIWVDLNTGKPLFAHEFGHAIGLGHSHQSYCDTSIMCGIPAQDFSAFDKAIIAALYHPDVKKGETFDEIKPVIADLLKTGKINL